MALVEIQKLYDGAAAEIVRGWLGSAGIDAVLFDESLASLLGGGFSGVRVMVDAADAAAARALLAEVAAR